MNNKISPPCLYTVVVVVFSGFVRYKTPVVRRPLVIRHQTLSATGVHVCSNPSQREITGKSVLIISAEFFSYACINCTCIYTLLLTDTIILAKII